MRMSDIDSDPLRERTVWQVRDPLWQSTHDSRLAEAHGEHQRNNGQRGRSRWLSSFGMCDERNGVVVPFTINNRQSHGATFRGRQRLSL